MNTKIFVNLPVRNLEASMDFFSKLGFTFNPKFTDKNAACMIISDNIYSMLITHEFFKTFTNKEISDSGKNVEVITSLTVNSREEVDKFMEKVLAAGGCEPREFSDHGFMYLRTFEDPDSHLWEIFWMDENSTNPS